MSHKWCKTMHGAFLKWQEKNCHFMCECRPKMAKNSVGANNDIAWLRYAPSWHSLVTQLLMAVFSGQHTISAA
jgi:hypothetical protein